MSPATFSQRLVCPDLQAWNPVWYPSKKGQYVLGGSYVSRNPQSETCMSWLAKMEPCVVSKQKGPVCPRRDQHVSRMHQSVTCMSWLPQLGNSVWSTGIQGTRMSSQRPVCLPYSLKGTHMSLHRSARCDLRGVARCKPIAPRAGGCCSKWSTPLVCTLRPRNCLFLVLLLSGVGSDALLAARAPLHAVACGTSIRPLSLRIVACAAPLALAVDAGKSMQKMTFFLD